MSVSNTVIKTLYLPSTPLNILVSSALAVHNLKNNSNHQLAEIWLIDQKNTDNNPYFKALKGWKNSPFQYVSIFSAGSGDTSTNKKQTKRESRKQNFLTLTKELQRFTPNQVAVGSDRRVEFQFVMQTLVKKRHSVLGIYLDDGLYSYVGRPYHFIKDGVNALLKKIAYGFWWQEPKTVGASAWIDQAWLFSPEHAFAALQSKRLYTLLPDWFTCSEMLELSALVAQQLDYDTAGLSNVNVVMLIPHPNNIKKMPGYEARIQTLVKHLSGNGKKVAVKYHPRSSKDDFLSLKEHGAVDVIPAQLAFEFCLPLFSQDCLVVGDVGTALLSCKWLRPDLTVVAVLDESDPFQKKFISLSKMMGINVTNQIEDVIQC
ncbi:hypothetical protein JCM30760_19320 [Thiomicrorhabdus hydrogeniphila]